MSLSLLHQKISAFEAAQSEELQKLSQCQQGCSRCCYVDLSVFEIEASYIRQWFHSLSSVEKQKLRAQWSSLLTEQLNFQNQSVKSCVFLRQESCTIYPVRPVICRTQGLPLTFRLESQTHVDVCPLNEEMLNQATASEILNLETLNVILAQMEKQDAHGSSRQRVSLRALFDELNQDG